MNIKKVRTFLIGFLSATLIFCTANPAMAAMIQKTITVSEGVNIYVNNSLLSSTNGLIYNGTTYLPVRAVSQALGQEVSWDGNTKSVYIGVQPTKTETQALAPSNAGKISAPVGNILCSDGLGFSKNSADGIKVFWNGINLTGKTINYYTVYVTMYNSVGDLAYDEINGLSTVPVKYVGPAANGEMLAVYKIVAYSSSCSKIVIDKIDVQYSDGTIETIPYGYSGGQTLIK